MPSYVVAGASRGLGLEFVEQLAKPGNIVFAMARNPSQSKGLQALSKKPEVHILKADITDPVGLRAAAAEVAKVTGGSLDVLINNAAYVSKKYEFLQIDEFATEQELIDDFKLSFDTNVLGPVLTTNAFLPLLRKGHVKKVLTLSTGIADAPFVLKAEYAYSPAYCVSKTGVEMANVKYAIKYKKEGFVFLAISPGVVNTAEEPAAPEIIPKLQEMAAAFQKVAPHFKGPIEPNESVSAMLSVLDRATIKDSGSFVSHLGTREWL
ncbi:NAD(P)-binding protein [Exidia glandulosa HHB12029]|uniref:NAD(P)-binding protein n=1 Tax=Exidia glandulosa HHB12029 TaxID=1314781 RepID=A0A165NCV4_EXIGL|nr:NAD(P)-binding protein [Exidia glandulosa HHB12029]